MKTKRNKKVLIRTKSQTTTTKRTKWMTRWTMSCGTRICRTWRRRRRRRRKRSGSRIWARGSCKTRMLWSRRMIWLREMRIKIRTRSRMRKKKS